MAIDGITIRNLAYELNQTLQNARVDKIYQPERDEIVIGLRTANETKRLVLSANAGFARAHLTERKKENPMTAPFFCMLLRKRLTPAKLLRVFQKEFERILIFEFACTTELGDPVRNYLIAELMGRHSNLIFTDENKRIIDSVKHIDITVSSVRQVLPGLPYLDAPSQNKQDPLTVTEEELRAILSDAPQEQTLSDLLLHSFCGLSPLACREIAFRAAGDTDARPDPTDPALLSGILAFFADIRDNRFCPTILVEGDQTKEFASFDLTQYGQLPRIHPPTASEMLEQFFDRRESRERLRSRAAAMEKTVSNLIERCAKKSNIYQKTIRDAEHAELHKQYGDLIMANLYRIREGDTTLTADDFYTDPPVSVQIALDPQKSPSQNAQHYYTRYTKQKTAKKMAEEQLALSLRELEYLESVKVFLESAKTPSELSEIRDELYSQGYLSHGSKGKRNKSKTNAPRTFVSSDGFVIYVGKNNLQNDAVTFRLSRSRDLWLHTKNIPGSHTLIVRGQADEIPDRTLEEAAMLCALHSKAKNGVKVAVDYTECKNVKKIAGAKPGMVIYERFSTVFVTPDPQLADRLEKKE